MATGPEKCTEVEQGKNTGAGRRERTQCCKGVEMETVRRWRYDEQGAKMRQKEKDKAKKEGEARERKLLFSEWNTEQFSVA